MSKKKDSVEETPPRVYSRTVTMHNENKAHNGCIPIIRFPEFQYKCDWKQDKLGCLFSERIENNYSNLPLLSLTEKDGVIPQSESNRRDNSNSDKSKYLRVYPGDIAYNTMRMWEGRCALVGLEGLVSPAYTVCKPNKDVSGTFFSYYFKSYTIISLLRRYSQGLVKDTLSLKYDQFAQIDILYPESLLSG